MAKNSNISWTDNSFNPWIGCTKVSPGCKNCYAAVQDKLRKWTPEGWGGPRRRTSVDYWKQPLSWNRNAEMYPDCCANGHRLNQGAQLLIGNTTCPAHVEEGKVVGNEAGVRCSAAILPNVRPRVFCASLADWLDNEVPIEWLADLLKLIHDTPNSDWQLLTKRPQNWKNRLHEVLLKQPGCDENEAWVETVVRWIDGFPPSNIWLGTSVEDQQRADERIPELLKIPAKVHFLSAEPLLGPINFEKVPGFNRIGLDLSGWWVISGGESGSNRREMEVSWIQSIANQCRNAKVPFFCKQDSGPKPGKQGRLSDELFNRKEFPCAS